MFLYNFFVSSIFTIINLITITICLINRNFVRNQKDCTLLYCIIACFCCFCCICTKNVIILKQVNFICFLISLFWSFRLLYYAQYINLQKGDIIKLIIYFTDTILLFGQSYFFYYYDYFLNRVELYIELYKRLIIKNRKNEAELIRRELPANIEGIDSGTEMENV